MDPLPPDPYLALGVSKDADSATIKSVYRKLVLKCHPDKVSDESLKAQKQEEFHKIQTAYETLIDDDKRKEYEATVRLFQLKKEALERGSSGPRPDGRGSYGVRTAVPNDHKTASRSAYDDRRARPSASYDDDKYYESPRKHDYADRYAPRRSSARPREREDIKLASEKIRSERRKARDQNERADRDGKYSAAYDDSDERAHFESGYHRRNEEQFARDEDELRARKLADDARRQSEEAVRQRARVVDDYADPHSKKLADAKAYMSRAVERDPYLARRSSSDRPDPVRRSSGRPRERESSRSQSYRERRGSYEDPIVEERRPPTLQSTQSSPASIKIPRDSPVRAQTTHFDHDSAPPPSLRRTETAPVQSSSSPTSRRDRTVPTRSSTLREATTIPHDSGYSSPSSPEGQQSASTKYYYSPGSGATRVVDDRYQTIIREPGRRRRSPSPIHESRTSSSARTVPLPHYQAVPPPPLQRSATARSPERHHSSSYDSYGRTSERERERGRMAYGEVRGSRYDQPRSYKFEDIKFAPSFDSSNVSYAERPSVQRTTTTAY